MGEYRISELAERSGFAASTLRFYEQVGLLPAAQRSPGGYRLYGEATVQRLRFIASGKRLGLPLEEIRELVAVWHGGTCGPVQDRLRPLLTEKVTEVDTRVAELTAFSAQLAEALADLGRHTPDGPCADGCGCLAPAEPAAAGPLPVQLLTARPVVDDVATEDASAGGGERIVCSLSGDDQPARMREWAQLLTRATSRAATGDGVRLVFPADPVLVGQVAELAAREQQCCRFFEFTLYLSPEDIVLDARGPLGAEDLVRALFEQVAL